MTVGFDLASLPGGLSYAKLSQILADAGFTMPAYEQNVAGGIVSGQSARRQPLVSANRRLAVGVATKLFDYQFSGAAQNTTIWKCLFATMTMTQGSGTLLMNANGTLTTTTGCQLSTWRYVNFPGNGTVSIDAEVIFNAAPLANQVFLFGAFPSVSATATPTDGVYFKLTSTGLYGVVNYNGVETSTALLVPAASFALNQNYDLKIDVSNGGADFWLNDTLLATLPSAAANPTPMNWGALPITLQQYNVGAVSGSPQLQVKVGTVSATQRDLATEKLWESQQGLSGLNASQGSEGGTMGTTALYSNSLAIGAGAALTNTTAAAGSGLGGQFTVLPTLAAGTDGVLQSFQNPVGSITQIPRTIMIKGVWLQGIVTTIFAGGPVLYAYSLAYGHTNVSLATADSASFATGTTKSARRVPLGVDNFLVTAPVGTMGQRIYQAFNVPIVLNPGEFVAIVAKNLGTVTTTGAITFVVGFNACYE